MFYYEVRSLDTHSFLRLYNGILGVDEYVTTFQETFMSNDILFYNEYLKTFARKRNRGFQRPLFGIDLFDFKPELVESFNNRIMFGFKVKTHNDVMLINEKLKNFDITSLLVSKTLSTFPVITKKIFTFPSRDNEIQFLLNFNYYLDKYAAKYVKENDFAYFYSEIFKKNIVVKKKYNKLRVVGISK